MEYRQHRLSNGLEILAECNDQAHVAAFGFFVRAGARDESPEIGGVSHFLEHMVFKGTPRRTAEQVNLELDEMGSNSNARTSEESTIYHATVLPEFQSQIVELLSDLMRPSLRNDDFATEQQVILEEILMYLDQPPYGGHERLMSEFYGEHPLGQSVLGTVQSVSSLTPELMHDYFKRQYSPANMALAATGKIDFEKLVYDAERNCGGWNSFHSGRQVTKARTNNGFFEICKPNSAQQYILQLAPGPAAEDSDRYAARLLAAILGDDCGSRMFWQFVDSGLSESAGMGSSEYQSNGLFMSYLCCQPADAQENIERLHSLLRTAERDGVSQKELDLAKQKISSHIVLASERTESRMFSVGSQWLNGQPFKSVGEIAAAYQAVTLDEVNQVLIAYPLTRNMTLSVGPQKNLKPAIEF